MINFNALDLDYTHLQTNFSALNSFANELNAYFKSTQAKIAENLTAKSTKYSERNIASNELARFFGALGFEIQIEQDTNAQSVHSAIDLALLENGVVKVIIEAKLPESITKNKQMFSAQNTNCKALHEAILYYLREVNDKQNYGLENIIITDFSRFYIFGYKEFERIFAKNTKIRDIFARYKNDTSSFYAKARDILDSLDDEISGICVDLERDLGKNITKQDSRTNNAIQNLYKIFHKDFLFNDFQQISPLNQQFYDEILYILGLEERNAGAKIIIESSKESNLGQNTLYHLIDSHLTQIYGTKSDIDTIMQYIILWLNRILFLKLIEANIVRFNDDKSLAFLRKDKIKNYQDLSNLFFEVLAKKPNERKDSPFDYLPYLNSSLFDKHECEEILNITMLDNDAEFVYYHTTQVKKDGKRQRGRVNLLSYIFEFLDAFDFGSGKSDESNIIEQKKLIKTSVLGLVFEKLNGYKEGSFFTPNFITAFMCKESLQKVVLDKFNSANPSWGAKNLADLAILIRDERERKDEFKALLRSVKICDPAVGSGHFLVSALCEMVRIYHALRLSDELNEYDLKIDDDEIIVYVSKDMVFEYKKPTKPNDNNQRIQKSLFNLKKSIIENNLFGVDINPNSVEICKLRLWIELLKNSYYLVDSADGFNANLSDKIHQMQTLPNIDINIKCGNSLLSRFSLNDSLPTTQNIKNQISEYKKLVFDYKNADQQSVLKQMSKKDIESKIDNLKSTFRLTLKDPKTKGELEKAIKKHTALYGLFALDDKSLLDGLDCGVSHSLTGANLNENDKREAFASFGNIKFLRDKLDSNGNGYKNAFEWRFEFPEVLNENGDFMGFDLIIGNPPYIDYREINAQTIEKTKHYAINQDSNRPNIYCYFAERGIDIITNNGFLSFVNPIAMLQADFAYGTRKLLLEKGCIDYIADCSHIKAFDSASTYASLWLFLKNKKQDSIRVILWQDDSFKYSHNIESYANNKHFSINLSQYNINFQRVNCNSLGELGTLKWGTSQSGYGKKKIHLKNFKRLKLSNQDKYKPIIQTADIKRYAILWQEEYIPSEIYSQNIQEDFKKPKIVIARMTKHIQASFDNNGFYMGKATLIVDFKENPYYILGILNSKLADFWYKYYFGATHLGGGYIRYDIPYLKQLPIPKLTAKNKKIADKIVNLVDKILESKSQGKDSTAIESQIDDLVYKLYELDSHEIQIIESTKSVKK